LEKNPKDQLAYNNKGSTYNELKEYDKAIESFNKTIMMNPCSDIAWLRKGNAFYNLERYKDALKCFERSFQLNSNNEEAIKNKFYAMEKLKMI
jgi:tetratricopeptide (TPR) repeat protein